MKACHKITGKETRGFVPTRYHFPKCMPPQRFGYLSRTYGSNALLVHTREVGHNVQVNV